MKFALDPALLIGHPVPDAFRAAAESGYEAVELGNRDDFIPAFGPMHASQRDLRAARRAAQSAAVEIASVGVIQAWSSPVEELRSRAVERWLDGAHAAIELGCRRINSELSGDPNTPEECRVAFLRSMETLLPVLEREDITLSIEPHPWDFLETTVSALELLREVGSPRIRYLHCIPHTYYLGGSVVEQVEHSRGEFDHIHIADTFRPGRTIVNPPGLDHRIHQHFDIGSGEIAWPDVVRALKTVGFAGLVTVQVFGWAERALESFRINRAAVDRLFGTSA